MGEHLNEFELELLGNKGRRLESLELKKLLAGKTLLGHTVYLGGYQAVLALKGYWAQFYSQDGTLWDSKEGYIGTWDIPGDYLEVTRDREAGINVGGEGLVTQLLFFEFPQGFATFEATGVFENKATHLANLALEGDRTDWTMAQIATSVRREHQRRTQDTTTANSPALG